MKGEDKFSRAGRVAFDKANRVTAKPLRGVKPIKSGATKLKSPRPIRKRPKY